MKRGDLCWFLYGLALTVLLVVALNAVGLGVVYVVTRVWDVPGLWQAAIMETPSVVFLVAFCNVAWGKV